MIRQMRVYAYRAEPEKFAALEPVDEADLDLFIDGFETRPMLSDWPVPSVHYIPGEIERGLLVPDIPLLATVPAFNERAVEILQHLLEPHGELLPLMRDDGQSWAYNVLTVVDAMDEARSDARFLAPGRISTLRQLVLKPTSDELPAIFKLPQWRKGRAIITETFVDAVRESGLTGFDPIPFQQGDPPRRA